jgi:hypothetical protein
MWSLLRCPLSESLVIEHGASHPMEATYARKGAISRKHVVLEDMSRQRLAVKSGSCATMVGSRISN